MLSKPVASYELTIPPSVNVCYSNGRNGGRFKNKRYIEWVKLANREMLDQKIIHIKTKVIAFYSFGVPDNRIRDCANYEKVLTDYLVNLSILKDDSLIRCNIQQWEDWEPKNRKVRIFFYEI